MYAPLRKAFFSSELLLPLRVIINNRPRLNLVYVYTYHLAAISVAILSHTLYEFSCFGKCLCDLVSFLWIAHLSTKVNGYVISNIKGVVQGWWHPSLCFSSSRWLCCLYLIYVYIFFFSIIRYFPLLFSLLSVTCILHAFRFLFSNSPTSYSLFLIRCIS